MSLQQGVDGVSYYPYLSGMEIKCFLFPSNLLGFIIAYKSVGIKIFSFEGFGDYFRLKKKT